MKDDTGPVGCGCGCLCVFLFFIIAMPVLYSMFPSGLAHALGLVCLYAICKLFGID